MKFIFVLLAFASSFTLFSQTTITNTQSTENPSDTIVVATPSDTIVVILPEVMSIILPKKEIHDLIPIDIPSRRIAYEEAEVKEADKTAFSHLNVSLRLNTLGIGLEAATPLNKLFVLRGGVDILPVNLGEHTFGLVNEFDKLEYAFGYIPEFRGKGKINFFNGHILVDFHPVKSGIFHLTAGVFAGSNKATLDGFLVDQNNNPAKLLPGYDWPVLEYGNQRIDLTGGRMDFDLKLGGTIKPYIGFGLGRAFVKKRVGFKFELGVMYQGDYTLKQNGIEFEFKDLILSDGQDIDEYSKWLKWWPMMNFQLSYRIF